MLFWGKDPCIRFLYTFQFVFATVGWTDILFDEEFQKKWMRIVKRVGAHSLFAPTIRGVGHSITQNPPDDGPASESGSHPGPMLLQSLLVITSGVAHHCRIMK